MSVLSHYYGLPDIPEDVLKAARTVLHWANSHDWHDWTIYGIGPRFCRCKRPPLVVINSPEETVIGTQQTVDDDAEVYCHD